MSLPPIGEVGVGAISGGTLVALAIKLLPILFRKFNGRNRNNRNSIKPGFSKECIGRGEKIAQHDVILTHLCGLSDKAEKQAEIARKENREDHQLIFKKLDELKK